MTRVLHIIKATRYSGAERHVMILLPALRQRGIDARLLLLTEPDKPMDDIAAAADAAQVPLRRLTIRRGLDVSIVPRLAAEIRTQQPDLVHTHLIHADVFGLLAARQAGVKHVVTTRHNDDNFRRRWPLRLLHAWMWRRVSAGVVISQALADFVRTVEFAPPERVTLIHYGLAHSSPSALTIELARRQLRLDLGNLPYETQLIGIVSRLIEQKGIPYALEAFQHIAEDFPKAHLVIAGDGDQRPALEAQARAMLLGDRIHFLGWRSDPQAVMQGLDVLLMPSLWEGFGLTLLEAMSARLPVVASHVSAIPEIVVHGETGFLVAPRDSEAIAYALRILLADPLLCKHLGLNGEDRLVTHFSAERMADQTAALYARLLGQQPRRALDDQPPAEEAQQQDREDEDAPRDAR
jgi:glycosyltransferase involved in cell wall biosynthesis